MKRRLVVKRMLASSIKTMLKSARTAAENEGREICGLLIDNGYFLELVQARNKAKSGGKFEFYYREIQAVVKMAEMFGHEVVGTFHSHPVGIAFPGKSDIKNAVDDSLMLIFDVVSSKQLLWHIANNKAKPVKFRLIK